MKKVLGTIFTLSIGLVGISILYMAVNQYLLEGETLYDYGLHTKATVIGEVHIDVRRRGASDRMQDFVEITPIISFEHPTGTFIDTTRRFTRLIRKGEIDDPEEVQTGDTLSLIVSPYQPEAYILEGDTDDNNGIGFFLWGAIGAAIMFWFYKRFRKLFPQEAATKEF